MEQNRVIESYKILKSKLEIEGFHLVLGASYSHNQKRYYFDLVVYKDNREIAIFEFKTVINWDDIPAALYSKCNTFCDIFPLSKPLIIISDGEQYAQFIEPKKFDKFSNLDDVIEIIIKYGDNLRGIKPSKDKVIDVIKGYSLQRMNAFIDEIESKDDTLVFDTLESNSFYFTEKYEKLFFRYLLGNEPQNSLYRYTSIDTLFMTLETGKQSMSSLLGMNDQTECYYADQYLSKILSAKNLEGYNNSIQYKKGCYCFILSCVSNESENIRMWDEYGDSAKGVRIKYDHTENYDNSFWIAPVSYAKEDNSHPELDLIAELRNNNWDMRFWDSWQHFFKPNAFQHEYEVRLLYICEETILPKNDVKWIHKGQCIFPLILFDLSKENIRPFPYSISRITFGPLSHNQEVNKEALKELILANHIKVGEDLDILFTKSQIQEDFEN